MKKTNRSHVRQTGKSVRVFKSGANLGSARLRAIPFALAIAFGSTSSFADPAGAAVAAGQVSISAVSGVTTIHQISDRAVVNWQSFNVNAGEAVKFIQPSSTAAILNRVTGGSVSNINGLVEGNGRVYLINPNGIVVGANGVVNVNGGFVASTKSLADSAFMSGGALVFTGESTGSIQILGKVQSAQGDVILIAPKIAIEKTGSLIAGQTIKLVAANEVELSNGKFTVKPKAGDAGQLTIEGALEAAKVQLAANNNNLGALAINTTGTIRATGTQTNPDGSVTIMAEGQGSNIKVSGTIEAKSYDSSKNGGSIIIGRDPETGSLSKSTDVSGATLKTNKGFVETSGDFLATNGVSVKAAEWLLDPSDITISNSANSNISGTSPSDLVPTNSGSSIVQVSTIQNAINFGTSVTIKTTNSASSNTTGAGNIIIADALTFTNNSNDLRTLTLIADNGIIVNKAITTNAGSGSGLVNVSMTAKGNFQGTDAANASSKGITLNSTITTNGNVTLNGTNQNTSGGRNNGGVVFNGGSGITAKEINVTGIQKRSGTTDANGIAFNGSTTFNSTGTSVFDGRSSSIGNASAGVYVEDGATLNLNSGAGSMHFKGDNTNAGYRGIRLGFISPATTNVNTTGNVIFGTDANAKQTFLRANLNVNSGSATLQGSEVQFYDGAVLTAKNGTMVNLTGQSINLGQAGSSVIKKDTGGFSLNMTGDTVMIKNTASVDAGTGTVALKALTSDREIQLGADDVVGSKMGLTNAELGLIKAGQVVIGDTSSNGAITVAVATSTNATTGNIILQTGGNISINATLNVGGVAGTKNLTLNAAGAVSAVSQNATGVIKASGLELLGANATHTLTNTGNTVTNLVGNTGTVNYINNGALVIGKGATGLATIGLTTKNAVTVQAITSVSNTAGITVNEVLNTSAGGNITLIGTATGAAHRGVTVNADVGSATAGSINITGTSAKDTGIFQTVGTISSKEKISLLGSGLLGVNLLSGSLTSLAGGASFAGADAILIKGTGTTNLGVLINTNLNNNSAEGNTVVQSSTGNGVQLNSAAKITNASTAGDIKIEAKGNGSIGSSPSGVRASITQNANRFVFLTTEGNGNLTSADIFNNGNKDVVIAAGNNLSAGNGAGGQVLAGGSVTQGSTGKLFVYSGNASDTGLLTSLSSGFSALKVTGDASQNAEINFAYNAGAGITGSTANAQVMFREKVTISDGLVGTSMGTTYGDLNTQTNAAGVAELLSNTKAKLKQEIGNSGSLGFYNTTSGGTGNNNIQISKSVIIDSLDGGLTATSTNSSGSHLKVGSYNYGPLTSTKYTISGIDGDVKVTVAKKDLNDRIDQGNSIYGNPLVAGAVTLSKVGTDDVNATGVTIDTTGKTSTSGNLRAGTHADIQSLSGIAGADSGNYTFVNVKGDYKVNPLTVAVVAQQTNLNYTGALLTQNQPSKPFISGDIVNVSGLATGTAVGLYRSALSATGDDVNNYDIQFVDDHLVIAYSGANKAPTPTETYTRIAGDVVNLSPVSFAVGVTAVTAAGDEADPNICYAWGQRDGGSVIVHTLLKPSYLGLRHAKTDTQEAMGNGGASSAHSANPCGHDVATNVAQSNSI